MSSGTKCPGTKSPGDEMSRDELTGEEKNLESALHTKQNKVTEQLSKERQKKCSGRHYTAGTKIYICVETNL